MKLSEMNDADLVLAILTTLALADSMKERGLDISLLASSIITSNVDHDLKKGNDLINKSFEGAEEIANRMCEIMIKNKFISDITKKPRND